MRQIINKHREKKKVDYFKIAQYFIVLGTIGITLTLLGLVIERYLFL